VDGSYIETLFLKRDYSLCGLKTKWHYLSLHWCHSCLGETTNILFKRC